MSVQMWKRPQKADPHLGSLLEGSQGIRGW